MGIKTYQTVEDYLSINNLQLPSGYIDFERILSKKCRSSYIKSGFGKFFSALAYEKKYSSIVELGVLDGYSLLSMAFGCKSFKNKFRVYGVDLFDEYKFKNSKEFIVQNLINDMDLSQGVFLKKGNVFADESVLKLLKESDLIHVDLSNDKEKVEKILFMLSMNKSTKIIFEGGSLERDNVDWMVEYKKPQLRPYFSEISKNGKYNIEIIECFPSITILSPKK